MAGGVDRGGVVSPRLDDAMVSVVRSLRDLGMWRQLLLLAAATSLALSACWYRVGDFASLWLTPDQRGRLAMRQLQFAEAAQLFDDPAWSAMASYEAGDYTAAAASFARVGSAVGSFNRGDALIKARDYEPAIAAFDNALAEDPGFEDAEKNRDLVRYILEYLEDLRVSSETGDQPDLTADDFKFDNRRNRGLEVAIKNVARLEARSADQWMRTVDTRMSEYLRTRFRIESAQRGEQ